MAATFVVSKGRTGKFRFNLLASNKQVILTSESYAAKASALNGVESVRKNAALDERFERKTAKDGSVYFVLLSRNGQVIGTSQMYKSGAGAAKGIASVKANAPSAKLVED